MTRILTLSTHCHYPPSLLHGLGRRPLLDPPLSKDHPPSSAGLPHRVMVTCPDSRIGMGGSGGRSLGSVGRPRSTDGIFLISASPALFLSADTARLCMRSALPTNDSYDARQDQWAGGIPGIGAASGGVFWLFLSGQGLGGRGYQSRPSGDLLGEAGAAVFAVGAAAVEDAAACAVAGGTAGTGGFDTPRGHRGQSNVGS
jgi:hypothetical protein